MHQNRETFELSARGSEADRPEKAESRTTGMNGTKESDRAVVPVNQTNKGELPGEGLTAEDGEGRARTEENTSQPHTEIRGQNLFEVSDEFRVTRTLAGRYRLSAWRDFLFSVSSKAPISSLLRPAKPFGDTIPINRQAVCSTVSFRSLLAHAAICFSGERLRKETYTLGIVEKLEL